MNVDRFFAKFGALMGMGDSQAKMFVLIFAVTAGLAVYLAVGAAFDLAERARPESAVEFDERFSRDTPTAGDEFNMRAREAITVEVDEILPGGVLTQSGLLALCGSYLTGADALRYGWFWNEEEGLCRRLRERR